MSRFQINALGLLALVGFLAGCSETPVSLPLRSLERSREVSFACVDEQGTAFDINSCPDFDSVENPRHMLALVTQTLRGEVAIVDLSAGKVVDLDKSTPGYSFIPVGGSPIDIVTTPGSVASFVGVGEIGREGIFAIPSSCTRPPGHDLNSWPACRLPTAPGEMAIVVDPADDQGLERASCDGARTAEASQPGTALAATREECPADLALESSPPGRRKLVVMLPEMGMYAIIDAQAILDREPGTYQPCPVERWIALDPTPPPDTITQKVPADLQAPGCLPSEISYGPPTAVFTSMPGGIDLSDTKLFIADQSAPLIHVHDLRNPCEPDIQPTLLPHSYEAPNRIVTTSQVAVSPPTSKGERFAYAIDDFDGSVMIFDVSEGHSDRTPIVRPGSPRLPFEAPDRIFFGSPARDVVFALRDAPIADPQTGVATIGTYCDPNWHIPVDLPAAKLRPSSDLSKGAGPRNLRGVFGFVMLSSGQIGVVDVEDFDAECRRPVGANSADTEDFRGCVNDPAEPAEYRFPEDDPVSPGKRSVSGELSCRMFEQHRSRSGHFLVNAPEFGVNAPALRSFPTLRAAEGGSLSVGQTEDGRKNPKLLAVDFSNPKGGTSPAEVYVGTTLYQSTTSTATAPVNELPIDPEVADRLSIALSFNEPRAFGGDEDLTLQYEGVFVPERPAGFPVPSDAPNTLRDTDASFCNRGVQDVELTKLMGQDLKVSPANLDAFSRKHADYVQITQKIPDEDSSYWDGVTCGDQSGRAAFFACKSTFGTEEQLSENRDFRIVAAYQDHLVIEPRGPDDDAGRAQIVNFTQCCFRQGAALSYQVRAGSQWVLTGTASGFRHNVIALPSTDLVDPLRCVRDCNPRRAKLNSRVFEVSAKDCVIPPETGETNCAIGPARGDDYACVIDKTSPLEPGKQGDQCIYQSLTHRFAIYRGNDPLGSQRDSAFLWSVTGAWTPLTANLAAQSRAVSPQSMVFVPQIGQLAVADGAAEGLVLVSLDSVAVSRLFF